MRGCCRSPSLTSREATAPASVRVRSALGARSSWTRRGHGSTGTAACGGCRSKDPFQGEDAPAGPMFNRDRSVRMSWSRPGLVRGARPRASAFPGGGIAARARGGRRAASGRAHGDDPRARARALRRPAQRTPRPPTTPAEAPSRIAERDRLRAELTVLQREREENELRLEGSPTPACRRERWRPPTATGASATDSGADGAG